MRLGMVSYFDIGASYGIGDEVFPEGERRNSLDILQVGIRNPLGTGITCDLLKTRPNLVADWRRTARSVLERKEMELGWSRDLGISEAEFTSRLDELIEKHPVTRCELTLYAVGTVLLWLEFGPGIDVPFLQGFSGCFEFAAYSEPISRGLHQAVVERLGAMGKIENPLVKLSERAEPQVEEDAAGWQELRLLTAFTDLVLCLDRGDEDHLPALLTAMDLSGPAGEVVDFEYHGTLHFGWANCVVTLRNPDDPDETPEQQVERILECIRIAHVFLGTCESFEKLMLSRIFQQVGDYVECSGKGRDPQGLNRLRTLALAVVSLTNFAPVAACAEDQRYFQLFERYARIAERNQAIQNRCDVLYSVQLADTQAEEAAREKRLSDLLALVAALAVISVFSDSYNFLQQGEQPLIPDFISRSLTLALLGVSIVLVVFILRYFPKPRR